MIEGAADWAVFMDVREFGAPVRWTDAAGAEYDLTAIFTAAHAEIGRGAGSGVSGLAPVLTLPPGAFLPFDPRAGDRCRVQGQLWRVADIQQDGSGMIRAILERAE